MSIKDVPMLTSDEKEITLNGLLYRVSWSSGYGFKKEGKFEIEALRVISLDNSNRHFRTRCVKGCESTFKFSEGCNRERLFGTLEAAKRELVLKLEGDLEEVAKREARMKETTKHILAQRAAVRATHSVKEPRQVRV
jgi:hypothetical protein